MGREGKTVTVVLPGNFGEVSGEDVTYVFWVTHSEKPLYYNFEETYTKDLTTENKIVPFVVAVSSTLHAPRDKAS